MRETRGSNDDGRWRGARAGGWHHAPAARGGHGREVMSAIGDGAQAAWDDAGPPTTMATTEKPSKISGKTGKKLEGRRA